MDVTKFTDTHLAIILSSVGYMMDLYEENGETIEKAAKEIIEVASAEVLKRYPGVDVEKWTRENIYE